MRHLHLWIVPLHSLFLSLLPETHQITKWLQKFTSESEIIIIHTISVKSKSVNLLLEDTAYSLQVLLCVIKPATFPEPCNHSCYFYSKEVIFKDTYRGAFTQLELWLILFLFGYCIQSYYSGWDTADEIWTVYQWLCETPCCSTRVLVSWTHRLRASLSVP